jgi:hypothetical protein
LFVVWLCCWKEHQLQNSLHGFKVTTNGYLACCCGMLVASDRTPSPSPPVHLRGHHTGHIYTFELWIPPLQVGCAQVKPKPITLCCWLLYNLSDHKIYLSTLALVLLLSEGPHTHTHTHIYIYITLNPKP